MYRSEILMVSYKVGRHEMCKFATEKCCCQAGGVEVSDSISSATSASVGQSAFEVSIPAAQDSESDSCLLYWPHIYVTTVIVPENVVCR